MNDERPSDFELLQRFARHGDQGAFAGVVRQHVDLVFATALRKVQDQGAAEEVAQNVFAALVKKAWQFAPDDSLPAWLYRTTLLESKEWLRGELRRRRREQTAAELGTTMKTPEEQTALRVLVPLLDEALLSLREKDRTALLLRFYEYKSLREVGSSLGVGEDAAQKRVAGALEKLSAFFQRRGFKTATVAAATAALQHTATSAPAAVTGSVILASAKLTPPALAGLAGVAARLASLTKLQAAAVCVALAAVPLAWEWQSQRRADGELRRVQTELSAAQTELSAIQVEIDRLNETSNRLAVANAAGEESAARLAEDARKFETWKKRIRAQLLAGDYRWPEDSPFVRIPKSVLRQLDIHRPVTPPGVLKQETRELLGLTPAERARVEDALHRHFAAMDNLIEDKIYQTNAPSHLQFPPSALASQAWVVPPLGDEAQALGDTLLASLQNTLGPERWQLVKAQTETSGTDTLRQILGLDASRDRQEIAVWIHDRDGKIVLGTGFSSGYSTSTSDGLALSVFATGATLPPGVTASDYWLRNLPESLMQRMQTWIQQQAAARLGTSSK